MGGFEYGGEDQGLGKEVSVEHRRGKVSQIIVIVFCFDWSLIVSVSSASIIVMPQLVGNNGHRRNRHRSKPLHVLLSEGKVSYLTSPCLSFLLHLANQTCLRSLAARSNSSSRAGLDSGYTHRFGYAGRYGIPGREA